MKRERKKERITAWLCVILVLILLAGAGVFVSFLIKDHLPQKDEIELSENEAVSSDEILDTLSGDTVSGDGEALDEETLNSIFEEGDTLSDDSTSENALTALNEKYQKQADQILQGMTIEQKTAQMFFTTQESITGVAVCTVAGDATKTALEKYPVGGILYFAANIKDENQLLEMTGNIQSYAQEISGIPMLIGTDEEGGTVTRIASNSNFVVPKVDDMQVIGESNDSEQAKSAGKDIGAYLKKYGFNIDFAPDADVITESENKVIGVRSFGTDKDLVSEMTQAYMEGLEENGVFSCPKHYPGHGATKEDSHEGQAYSERSWEKLKENELVPFINAISNGARFIMVSHICVPEVTNDETPASLSKVLITDKLRNELQYQGIIITDSLAMGAITEKYKSDEAAVKAIEAGADMLMKPEDFSLAYNGVLKAVSSGEISEDRINESVRRIIIAKLIMQGEN